MLHKHTKHELETGLYDIIQSELEGLSSCKRGQSGNMVKQQEENKEDGKLGMWYHLISSPLSVPVPS